ncbi:S1C family serine protease [Tomitella fengzijianii]|uniref:PDZ domain-containing protein n=1 Tax=Tomitella fengzijianii TaxID=2597660 RepID=A0A516X1V1_9ACTN|nr:trypsin-like peptidase domain-containing protein [Tomitella fengzijianii]QDQ97033.1 PDZ domain-containing protein [Tomitella fengzijianii]
MDDKRNPDDGHDGAEQAPGPHDQGVQGGPPRYDPHGGAPGGPHSTEELHGLGTPPAANPPGPGPYQAPGRYPPQGAYQGAYPGPGPAHYPGPQHTGPAAPPQQAAAPPRRRPGAAVLVAGALAFALVGGAVGGVTGAYFATNDDSGSSSVVQALNDSTAKAQPTAAAPSGSVQQVAQKVLPSVVEIKVATRGGGGEGSGIILSQDGMILTNNHVATAETSGPVQIQVTFADGSTSPAKIVASDPVTDIAVIKADKTGLTPIELGSSSNLQVGQQVVAIGSPLGLSGTVTSGIISALNRPVSTSGNSGDQATVIDAIQTDAAINPGNSGGALVNMKGQLVGMNTAIASLGEGMGQQSGSIGLGFAIPVEQVKQISQDLITTGHAKHAQIGITVPVRSNAPGALVMSVLPGGPADQAGIKKGQIVTKVGDRVVSGGDGLIAAVRSHAPGDKVTITVTDQDGGNAHTVDVTLGEAQD